jgi:hypothetical protein
LHIAAKARATPARNANTPELVDASLQADTVSPKLAPPTVSSDRTLVHKPLTKSKFDSGTNSKLKGSAKRATF